MAEFLNYQLSVSFGCIPSLAKQSRSWIVKIFSLVVLVPLIFFQGSKKNLLESIPTQSDQEKEVNIKKLEEDENLEDSATTRVDESLNIKVEAEEEKAKSG